MSNEPAIADRAIIGALLHRSQDLVADLHSKLQALDDLMLSGRPQEIATAASEMETALAAAAPSFDELIDTLKQLGTPGLQGAAEYLRRSNQHAAAGMADMLRLSLKRLAARTVKASRRGAMLNNGLRATLSKMQAIGSKQSGRLIAAA